MPPKGSARADIIGPLKDFFAIHPGETIKIHRLMTATGFDDAQIRSALNNARKSGYPLKVVTRGQAWVYPIEEIENPGINAPINMTPVEPVAAPVGSNNSEPVGTDEDSKGFYMLSQDVEGNPILQRDCDGTIWVAKRL